ncbi:aldose epimerase family protein [Roseivivax isoporae]|uniref:Galactose mutarotase n=1 Tax=Roseivivax isoporae LMG 25204 TaxID=1449351 RepID=X7F8C6_9RHOB|nr:aldose epimerase family protein [Roseivivax isoporae]ETX28361.1 galactose mutarotase [Roseivivax isoporae LMG 25204]
MTVETRGATPDGRAIHGVTLANGTLTAEILTFGAALRDLRLAGVAHPLVLGLADASDYAGDGAPYMGVIVGRVANRIAEGRAEIAGRTCDFDRNEGGRTTLHGGSDGTGRRLWRIVEQGPGHVVLADTLPDGHMGFPGTLDVQVTYRLDGAALEIEITAGTDAPTLCNFASHAYWNLSGATVTDDHRLRIAAETYQPVDDHNIPDGPPASVAGTRFDLRQAGALPSDIDHSYCLAAARRAVTDVLWMQAGGVAMTLSTTEPGLQVYDGRALEVAEGAGLDGRGYGARSGIAIEPQAWVDAANGPMRAQVDLVPGDTYRQVTRFAFASADRGPDQA